MKNTYYTYAHTKPDGSIFYIGKGKGNRAYKTKGRNKFWQNIANKHGHNVEILAYWETEQEAFDHEKLLILSLKDMKIELANMTDGGEGMSGHVASKETRAKMSKKSKGRKHTEEFKQYMSNLMANKAVRSTGWHHSEKSIEKMSNSKKGVKFSEEHKQKLSLAKKGKISPKKGTKTSEEVRKKQSLAKIGKKRKPFTAETIEKMRIARLATIAKKKLEIQLA
jgi:hypothetical protein